MYTPESFKVPDENRVFSFIERYDFATLVTSPASGGVLVSHIPLLLKRSEDRTVLIGHVARANDHWRHFDGATQSLAIFHGPHGYVSPTWYENKPAVPTWNYAVVHAYGYPRALEDPELTAAILSELVHKHENHRAAPWRMEDLPRDFYERMVSGIVAFEMPISKIESKFKLGQNRPQEDRAGTVNGLRAEGSADTAALAEFMLENV